MMKINMSIVLVIGTIAILPMNAAQAGLDTSGECDKASEYASVFFSKVTKVETIDQKFGALYYRTEDGNENILRLPHYGDAKMLPMRVVINGAAGSLKALEGKQVQSLRVWKQNCHFSHPVVGHSQISAQWIVRVSLAMNSTK